MIISVIVQISCT